MPGRSRLMLLGAAMLMALCILSVGGLGIVSALRGQIAAPFAFLQSAVNGIAARVSSMFDTVADLQDLRERNADLERALINAQKELVDLREIRADYQRLVPLVNYKNANPDLTLLAASVIGTEPTGLLRTITIDRGSRDGIEVGMPVVTELGLVGRIYQVGAVSSTVQLITDTNSFINARLQISRGIGLVEGTPANELRMTYIQKTDIVNVGDSVITSGIGGQFPRGIVIGQVISQQISDSQLFQEAQVRSLIPDLSKLEVVLIVTNFTPIDAAALEESTPTAP